MKRPLYYLLCAIACTSMVGATMPMAAVAEAIQPQAAAVQQAQADATSSDAGKAEDGANTNATADTGEGSTATSTGTSAANTESADATNASTAAATGTPAPSLRTQTTPTPEAISATSQTTYAHSATATQNGVTFTVSWNDAPAGTATTFHVTQANGSSQAKARMDVPTYWDGGSQESVCDPSRQAWASYYNLGTAGHDFTFDFTASGTYRIYFYFMDNDRNDPQNDKGIYYLRATAEVTVNDAARPSVTQIVNDAVDLCRQETDGSEYDMALWLHDWTLDQLEYDHGLNWCSAESGLTRHQGTCESYQRIYSKLLDAAGIANGRISGNGHTWNAVKIDGKWCQMDLTWDDTSDNWYGDLDQRHLYFGLTDELMAIAHSDHTANYQKDDYAYRSTDLSNNYFVRNGKADEWAEKYADRIQQHLNAKEESFSIDADNQSFPPSISGIQNGIVAYAMNLRDWKANDAKVELTAASNITKESNSKWSAKYDLKAEYKNAALEKIVPDGAYRIVSTIDPSSGVAATASGCSMSKAPTALRFAYDEATGLYAATAGGLALAMSGSDVSLAAPDGSASQRWELVASAGGYSLVNAGTGRALDDRWRDTGAGALVWGFGSSPGDPAQTWTLQAADGRAVPDGAYRIVSTIDPSSGVAATASGCSMSKAPTALRFAYDEATGLYAATAGGLALAMSGSDVSLAAPDGSASQRWELVASAGGYSLVNAGTGRALDDRWRDTGAGALVWGFGSSPGDPAQTWTLQAADGRAVPDGAYRIVSTIDPSSGVAATASGCSMSKAPTALRFAYDEATGLYAATAGGLALAMSGSDVSLAAPDGSASQRWELVASAGGYSLVNAGTGRALDDRWRDTGAGALVWGFGSSPGDPAQTWTLQAADGRAVPDGAYRIVSTIDPSSGVAATASGCSMSKAPTALRFAYDEATGLYAATAGGLALAMSGSDVSLAAPDGSASQRWELVASAGGYSLVNAGTGRALDDRWRDTGAGALVWGFGSSPGDPAQTWTLQAADGRAVPDGAYRIVSTIDPSSGVAATASGCSMSKAPTALRFAYDEATGLYAATAGGLALAMSGSDVSLAAPDGSASQRWELVASAGGYSLVNAGTGRALDDRWRDTGAGALVWGFGSSPGDPAQTWTLQAL